MDQFSSESTTSRGNRELLPDLSRESLGELVSEEPPLPEVALETERTALPEVTPGTDRPPSVSLVSERQPVAEVALVTERPPLAEVALVTERRPLTEVALATERLPLAAEGLPLTPAPRLHEAEHNLAVFEPESSWSNSDLIGLSIGITSLILAVGIGLLLWKVSPIFSCSAILLFFLFMIRSSLVYAINLQNI